MEGVVGGQRIGSRLHRSAHRRLGERELREGDRGRGVGGDVRADRFDLMPSISSVTGTLWPARCSGSRRPALTVMRSWPEKVARLKVTDGTEMLSRCRRRPTSGSAGSCRRSACPRRRSSRTSGSLKSAPLRGAAGSTAPGCSPPASAPARSGWRPRSAWRCSSAASSRPRSEVARMLSSALRPNSTSVARSLAPSELITSGAPPRAPARSGRA